MGSELRNFDVLVHWAQNNTNFVSSKLFHILNSKRKKLRKMFIQELIDGNALQKIQTSSRDFITHIKGLKKEEIESQVHLYIDKKTRQFARILPTASKNLKQLHEMRKIIKKIRYSLQLLPIIDPIQQHDIKEIQDMLGYINDRRVWINLLASHFKNKKEVLVLITVFEAEMYKKIDIYTTYMLNKVDDPISYFMKR